MLIALHAQHGPRAALRSLIGLSRPLPFRQCNVENRRRAYAHGFKGVGIMQHAFDRLGIIGVGIVIHDPE